MAERPMVQLSSTADLQVGQFASHGLARLKSWLPQYVTGGQPVVLGARELPAKVGSILLGEPTVFCIGPGEWLLAAERLDIDALRRELHEDLSRHGLALVDLSDAVTVIRLVGPAVRELLSKGCGLDLHPKSFPVGCCARTRCAAVAVMLHCRETETLFDLYVASSHAGYLRAWVHDAASEF